MGLAGPKRRSKLSRDPNNTTWSNSSNSYGQKILSSHGWKPGEYLGARDASHAAHYSAANKSHIKIMLREDNLGLGASVGKANADTFGLSLYSGVLSRLNGKSGADVSRQQNALRDAELRTYQATKYGFMNFVRGGLLVGDEMRPVERGGAGAGRKQPGKLEGSKSDPPAKRRKVDTRTSEDDAGDKEDTQSRPEAGNLPTSIDAIAKRKSKSKSKKSKRSEKDSLAGSAEPVEQNQARETSEERRQRRADRCRRKEEKRLRKLARSAASSARVTSDESSSESQTNPVQIAAPAGSRLAVRQRYIQQKRMASLDPRAMKEIFMMPAVALSS